MPKMRRQEKNVNVRTAALWAVRAALVVATVLAAVLASADQAIVAIIHKEAKKQGIDPTLMQAIATVESNLNPRAKGTKDDTGLFQLRKKYHAEGATFDPVKNARTAARYLAWLKKRPACAKHKRAYYVCYNVGPSGITKLDNVQQFDYYKKVEAARQRIVHRQSSERKLASN